MTLDSTLARAARSEQRLWRSACTIARTSGGRVMDPVTLKYREQATTVVYSGACQIKPMRRDRDEEQEVGDEAVAVSLYVVKVPADIRAERDDVVTITTSNDPAAFGLHLAVKDIPAGDWSPVRRLVCEVITA